MKDKVPAFRVMSSSRFLRQRLTPLYEINPSDTPSGRGHSLDYDGESDENEGRGHSLEYDGESDVIDDPNPIYTVSGSTEFLRRKLTHFCKVIPINAPSGRGGRRHSLDYAGESDDETDDVSDDGDYGYVARLENPTYFMTEQQHIHAHEIEMPDCRRSPHWIARKVDGSVALLTRVIDPDCAYVQSMIDTHKEEGTEYAVTWRWRPSLITGTTVCPDIVIYAGANGETPEPIIPIVVTDPGLLKIEDFGGESARYGRIVKVTGRGRIFMREVEEHAKVIGSRFAALTDFMTTILIDYESAAPKFAIFTDDPETEENHPGEEGTRFVFCCLILLALRQRNIPFHELNS